MHCRASDSQGDLHASTVLRACRNEHLSTLMHCCASWELVGKCFALWCVEYDFMKNLVSNLLKDHHEAGQDNAWCVGVLL